MLAMVCPATVGTGAVAAPRRTVTFSRGGSAEDFRVGFRPAALLREGSISVKFCSVDTRDFFQKGNLRMRTERAVRAANCHRRQVSEDNCRCAGRPTLAALLGFTAGGEAR